MTKLRGTILLFGLVLIAIYLKHDAQEIVAQASSMERKQATLQREVGQRDFQFMKRALELSALSFQEDHDHAFGSVVVLGSRIVGQGRNRVTALKDPSAHAEVEAIRDACKTLSSASLKGCSIYASGHPCPMCLSLIYLSGIEKVFYRNSTDINEQYGTFSSKDIYKVLQAPQADRPIPEIPLSDKSDSVNVTELRQDGLQQFYTTR